MVLGGFPIVTRSGNDVELLVRFPATASGQKIPIIVIANDGCSFYGDSPSNPGFRVIGLVDGDTEAVLIGLYVNFYINKNTPPGSYLLTVEGDLISSKYYIVARIDNLWRVMKRPGADVSGPPTLLGTPRVVEIMVNAVTIPVNPGSQTVEYAIATSPNLTGDALAMLKWQSGTTFTGPFEEGVTYYVYARSAENEYYSAGTAQVSYVISITSTGIFDTMQASVSELSAWMKDGTLFVSGLTPGKPWRIYNLAGSLLHQAIAVDDVATLSAMYLRNRGVHIVQSEGKSIKVMF
jgi:hypothetical protein